MSDEERRKLAGWFEGMEAEAWDEDLRRDSAPGGKGERLAKEIQREITEGKARPLEEGLAKATPLPFVTFRSLAMPRLWISPTACLSLLSDHRLLSRDVS